MKNRVLTATAAIVLIACLTPSFAAETKVALCEYCNSSAFRNAAEVTALSEPPRLVEGTQYVFVVGTGAEEIRYYEVVRENIEVCQSSDDGSAAAMSTGPVIDPDAPGPEIPECFSNWVTSSTQLAPPVNVVAEIRQAQAEFDKFTQEIQEFDIGELPIGVIPLDSATDLIGLPSDSHDPAVARRSLQNALSEKVADTWAKRRLAEARLTVEEFIKKIVDVSLPQLITVTFPNGTEINVQIMSPFKDENGNLAGLILDVVEGSARTGDISSIPTTAAGFVTVFRNGYTSHSSLINNLSDLFVRGGGRVIRGPSTGGGGCTATIMCWVEDGDQVCQKSLPDEQLSDC